jgi:hypothetical protein
VQLAVGDEHVLNKTSIVRENEKSYGKKKAKNCMVCTQTAKNRKKKKRKKKKKG